MPTQGDFLSDEDYAKIKLAAMERRQNPVPVEPGLESPAFDPTTGFVGMGIPALLKAGGAGLATLLGTMIMKGGTTRKLSKEAGVFAGEKAKNAPLDALKEAKALKDAGVPDREIHAKTGWFFGSKDGKPRFEISDKGTGLTEKTLDKLVDDGHASGFMEALLNHPKYFAAYPDEKSRILELLNTRGANTTGFAQNYPAVTAIEGPLRGILDLLPHELQHPVQQIEGFSLGVPTSASMHRQQAGEAEARLVEARKKFSQEELAKLYPPDMYDIPIEQQILLLDRKAARY